MGCVLSIIGLVAAAWAWQNVHPLVGILVGALFVGGLGWFIVGAGLGAVMSPRTTFKALGQEGKEFNREWQDRFGLITPVSGNHPPPGTFKAWLKANAESGISAGDWIDRQTGRLTEAERQRALSEGAVRGYCDLVSIVGMANQFPTFFLAADEHGLMVINSGEHGGVFFELPWDGVQSAFPGFVGSSEAGLDDAPPGFRENKDTAWILRVDQSMMVAPFVDTIAVFGIDKPDLFRTYLGDRIDEPDEANESDG